MSEQNPMSAPNSFDTTPNPLVQPGYDVWYQTKNPLQSTALWGLVVMLIGWAITKWVSVSFQSQVSAAVLEVAGALPGAIVSAYGRWKANRPLSLSGGLVRTTVK